MAPRTGPPKQLDIPLMWERDAQATPPTPGSDADADARSAKRAPLGRLWLGALADAGVVLLAIGICWMVVDLTGASLRASQLLVAGLAGLEIASVLIVACLWAWRGSPGMLLLGLSFGQPIPFARVLPLWLAWMGSLPLAGVPLLLRRGGASVAERLAGSAFNFHSPRGSA
ncbi:MAG: hypothetical protein ACHQQS_05020 [Thermoanaerobaculales bacterium]